MAQQEQQKASATPIPQKDKKNKRRQKASATATKKGQQDPSSVEQVGQSSSSNNNSNKPTPIPKSTNTSPKKRNRNAANKPSQPSNDNSNKTMYGEELPVPPTPRSSRISAKGKQKAIESNGNTGNMEDGEVDELDGLFFVDTAPGKLHKDILLPAERPVIAQRMRSVSPVEKSSSSASPSRSRSVSSVAQGDKVVPDYVGSSSEIKEANVITDDGVVEGSSKDLLNANTRQHSGGKSSSVADMEGQASRMPAVAQPSFEAASTNVSPGGAKRKRDDDAGKHINARTSGDAIMLLDDLSTDESDSSEEEPKRQRRQGEPILDDSHSEGESSGQDYGDAADNLALNVEPSVMRRPEPKSPQIAMQIDLTGSPPPADAESVTASAGGNRPITSLNGNLHDATTGDVSIADGSMVDANIDLEGVEDDEYQADRSRYFKEDDPLKVCARCGETGHTVRDCVHLQCLTCGKLDDHGTRSCPLTMTCFRCNSRGHHIKDCPLSPEEARNAVNQYCERCSSHTHKSSTCPYIWRVYIRAADAPAKPPKIHFACYNCASGDHFGDDCKYPRGHPVMNTERTAFTMDPDNHRKTHIRFDGNSAGSGSIPQLNNVNGQIQTEAPPSHAPRGPRSMQRKAIREDRKKPQPDKKRESLEDVLYSLEQERRKTGDFGDLGDLEAGEIDEDEDAFEKRLRDNKQQPKPPRGPKPGARDRRRARELGSKTNTDSSVNGDGEADPKKSFQPFKNFKEVPPPNGTSLNRPRSISRSPPPNRRRDARQPSPIAMDSPAQARSAANWKKSRGLQDRLQGGKAPGRSGFASGSLLDRIDRGSNSNDRQSGPSASRDPRDFDRREGYRDDYEGGYREARDRRGGDSYVPEGQPRRGGNPRYKGGYF